MRAPFGTRTQGRRDARATGTPRAPPPPPALARVASAAGAALYSLAMTPGTDDLARPLPASTGNKVLLGCVLVPVLFFFVTSVLGVLLFGLFVALGERGPGKEMSVAGVVGGVVTSLFMALFFGRVARGLVASMRGKEVPHLLPPWLTVALAVVMGLLFIATGIATLVGARGGHGAGAMIGMGAVFIAYAIHAIRARGRREAAAVPAPRP